MTLTYESASKLLASSKSGLKKIGNNTYLHKVDGGIGVRLHSTDVVVIHEDGTYTLDSGGWQTVTTKARINEFSPARLWQHKYVWYVGPSVEFYDGVRVDSQGKLVA